jgi:small subunit ribosomal protein S20
LANHKSAIKRIRSNERKRQRNRVVRSQTRTQVKQARTTLERGNAENAREAVLKAIRALDKAATKGVMHPNTVARSKSRLMKQLNQLDTQ